MAKGISWSDVLLVEVTIVDVETFFEVLLWVWSRVVHYLGAWSIVVERLADGVRQASAGVDVPKEYCSKSVTAFLSRKVGEYDSFYVW